tara:strand:- start:772 stop:1002 length:231 start_codon:yes stop_codon:yes gene_type:complete
MKDWIKPDKDAMSYQRGDVERIKVLYGWSWSEMSRYFGYADEYWKQKYYGGQKFLKSDAVILWLLDFMFINRQNYL